MAPDPSVDQDADPAHEPTEAQRALRAVALGVGLGVILALWGRRPVLSR